MQLNYLSFVILCCSDDIVNLSTVLAFFFPYMNFYIKKIKMVCGQSRGIKEGGKI
jgi:hypothetical protein